MKPVLFVTGHVDANRAGAFERLHERVPIELALFGGRHQHGAPPARRARDGPPPRDRAARGRRAGRERRLPRRRRRHGRARRAARGVARRPLARAAVRLLGGVVAHAPHRGAPRRAAADAAHLPRVGRGRHLRRARQRVRARARRDARASSRRRRSTTRSGRRAAAPRADARFAALFVGRPAREKGLAVALSAWRRAGIDGTLTVVGERGSLPGRRDRRGPRRSARAAQLLRRERRSGCTVDRRPGVSSSRGGWSSTRP